MIHLLLSLSLYLGVQPRPFADIAHEAHGPEYYTEQAKAWEETVGGDCVTEADWVQYFLAARYAVRYGETDYPLDTIAASALAAVPENGFAYPYILYWMGQGPERYEYLRAAHAVEPDNPLCYADMVVDAEINRNEKARTEFLVKIEEHNPYPADLIDYCYNTLQSVAQNGILITFGDADTYPAMLLQSIYGVRPDVLILNYYLLTQVSDYRILVMRELGTPIGPDFVSGEALMSSLISTGRPVHFAATGGEKINELTSGGQLYTSGLTFSNGPSPGVTDSLYREIWRMDGVREPLADSPGSRVAKAFLANYLVPLVELQRGDVDDKALDILVKHIAQRSGQTATLAAMYDDNATTDPQLASQNLLLSAKDIFERFEYGSVPRRPRGTSRKSFTPDYYMQTTEVSNGQYQEFLEDLLRQRLFGYIDSTKVEPTDWLSLLPDSIAELTETELYQHGRPESLNHPVVNIPHRAAELYAIWLTQVYNQDPKREGGRKVNFRLPTAAEFETSARGGHEHAPFPWGGPYYRNARGCILANLNALLLDDNWTRGQYNGIAGSTEVTERKPCDDGALFTSAVDRYFPNDFGLYNMSGNAAEMIIKDGQTMGGSWLDGPEALYNGVITDRQLPGPTTGFRLLMEYVGE